MATAPPAAAVQTASHSYADRRVLARIHLDDVIAALPRRGSVTQPASCGACRGRTQLEELDCSEST